MSRLVKKSLKGLTQHQKEQQSKINAGLELEELEALGHDSERKGAKAVIEKYNEEEKKEYNKEQEIKSVLQKKRHLPRFNVYKQHLATELSHLIEEEELPREFYWRVRATPKGIVVEIWKGDGSFYRRRATYVCGEIQYDFNAIERFALWVGDEVYAFLEAQNSENKLSSGIILPN